MANESKNPVFWSFLAFAVGIGLAFWGWHKHEALTDAGTKGSTFLIVTGIVLVLLGAVGFLTVGNRK